MLFAVEGRDDGRFRTWFAAEFEWNIGIAEPETQVELMCGLKGRGRAAGRDGEGFHVEDAAYGDVARAVGIGVQIGLVPGDAEGLVGQFDHEEIIFGVGSKTCDADLHFIVELSWRYLNMPSGFRQAGVDARRRDHVELYAVRLLHALPGAGGMAQRVGQQGRVGSTGAQQGQSCQNRDSHQPRL